MEYCQAPKTDTHDRVLTDFKTLARHRIMITALPKKSVRIIKYPGESGETGPFKTEISWGNMYINIYTPYSNRVNLWQENSSIAANEF